MSGLRHGRHDVETAPDNGCAARAREDGAERMQQDSMNDSTAFLADAGPVLSGRAHMITRAVNTFLAFPFLFDLVIKDEHFAALIEGRVQRDWWYLLSRFLQKSLWFWPRIID